MSPRRVVALVRQLPADSATVRARSPEHTGWGITEFILADLADALYTANWQRSGDSKRPRPKPYPRPGLVDPTVTKHGRGSWSIEEMREKIRAWHEPEEPS